MKNLNLFITLIVISNLSNAQIKERNLSYDTIQPSINNQDLRVANSFIILINDKLCRDVSGTKLVLSNSVGNKQVLDANYYAGGLEVSRSKEKQEFLTDTTQLLSLEFDIYKYANSKTTVSNYKILLERKSLTRPYIIVKIVDLNKRKNTYKYSFEVSGVHFSSGWIKSVN